MSNLVSIVIPVYNGGKYLEKTLDSVLKQTYKEIEILCVDDYSTDHSEQIIQQYVKEDSRIRYVKPDMHMKNGAKSAEYALQFCKGNYYFYMSQDDLMDANLMEGLVDTANRTGAEIVLPNMIWYYEGKENLNGIFPQDNDYDKMLSGEEAFFLSLSWKVHGFSLRKMELMQKANIHCVYYNSDEYYTRKTFLLAKNIAFADCNFYYRQDNQNAITKKKRYYNVEALLNSIEIYKLTVEYPLPEEYDSFIDKQIKYIIGQAFFYQKDYLKLCENKEELAYVKKVLRRARLQSVILFLRRIYAEKFKKKDSFKN